MALPLEDYALLGDTETTALVGVDGSVDWLCLPRLDSDACFAALLGDPDHGRWQIAPQGRFRSLGRRYRGDSLVLETDLANDDGVVRLVDFMPIRGDHPRLIRIVEGIRGRVRVRSECTLRFDYGMVHPWVRIQGLRAQAVAGPDTIVIDSDVDLAAHDGRCTAEFYVGEGEQVSFRLAWTGLRQPEPVDLDPHRALERTCRWWQRWADRCNYRGPHRDLVQRSLISLKALAYAPSGGIVAAATTSLPEHLGGVRNWDYRYCWIRDAAFTLRALLQAGYAREAAAWREWLLRALAGQPERMQIMYAVDGERRFPEIELPWLPGYAGSGPVRIGNAASEQFQLDVYGELMSTLHQAREYGIPPDPDSWRIQTALMNFLESHWTDPDNGLWEVRGPRRHFTHSKVMAWVAVDRAIRAVEGFGKQGPADRWKRLRQEIFDDVCARGYDAQRQTFTQYYGSTTLDAASLLIPVVGFLPATDPRVRGTARAIEKHLCEDGFVRRYTMSEQIRTVDGLPPGEAAFLACTFWLADNYILQGRIDRGRALFERLTGLCNDVGLLSEQYDPATRRLVGNIPQTFSHVALINTALYLERHEQSVQRRAGTDPRRHRRGDQRGRGMA